MYVLLGVALYLDGIGLVQNNSIIRTSITGRLNQLQCISGSSTASVGQWIAPNGEEIDGGPADSFTILAGDADDPGFTLIELKDGVSLAPRDQGVYSCVIPDENGNVHYLYIGLYLRGFNGKNKQSTYILLTWYLLTIFPFQSSLKLAHYDLELVAIHQYP